MTPNVQPSDWTCLDPWWSAYAQTQSIIRNHTSAQIFGMERLICIWDELDLWWNEYMEMGHKTVVELSDLLEHSNDAWKHSDAPFDTDPLAVNLTKEQYRRGPLQPSGEVGWSRWFARLLRPSVALITELFDVPVDQLPNEVIQEDRLSKQNGSFRRPDILLCHANYGISIEVKLGDENYGKTAETATLVEQHYDSLEWEHVLLLPRRKKERLRTIVEPSLDLRHDDRLQVAWDDPGPVTVLYWCDVTGTIRSLLRRGAVVDDHWAANAYLFCAVAEQQLLDFQPQPVVEQLAAPANVVDTLQPIGIANILEEQLTYLRQRVSP